MIEPDENKDVWRTFPNFPELLIDIEGRRVKRDSKFAHTIYKLGEGPQKINSVGGYSTVRLPRLFFAILHGCSLEDIPGNVMITKSMEIVKPYDLAIENLKKIKTTYTKEEIEKRINRDIDYLNVLKKAHKTGDYKVVLLIINRQKETATTRMMKNFRCARTTAAYYVDLALMPTIESVMAGRKISYPDSLLYQHARWLYIDEKKKKEFSYCENINDEEWQ